MPVDRAVEEAIERASLHVPEVIRTFMRMAGVDRYRVAEGMGLTPTQLTRRLSVPGALGQHELAGLAAYPTLTAQALATRTATKIFGRYF